MATLTVSISDALLEAFNAKFRPEEREQAIAGVLVDLVQEDPYSPGALAEDERSYEDVANGGASYSTDEVIALLRANIDRGAQ